MVADLNDVMPSLFLLSPSILSLTFEISPFSSWFDIEALQSNGFAFEDDQAFFDSFLHLISWHPGHPLDPSMYCVLQSAGQEVVRHLRTCTRLSMLDELDLSKFDRHQFKNLDSSTISPLSRLPSLRTLTLSPRLPPRGIPPPMAPWFTGFKSLSHLSLGYLPIDRLCDVLTISAFRASRSLRPIDLTSTLYLTGDPPSPIPVRELGLHLSLIRAALPDALDSFKLRFSINSRSMTEPPPPVSELLAPFLSLTRLKTFDIFLRCGLDAQPDVTDKDLHALSEAFPHLEVLRLWMFGPFSGTAPPPKAPTATGLARLARRCPRLCRVSIPQFDVSVLSRRDGTLHPDFGSEGYKEMRFLDVCCLVGDDGVAVRDVARVLSDRLFPCHDNTLPYDLLPGLELGTPGWSAAWLRVRDAMREICLERRR